MPAYLTSIIISLFDFLSKALTPSLKLIYDKLIENIVSVIAAGILTTILTTVYYLFSKFKSPVKITPQKIIFPTGTYESKFSVDIYNTKQEAISNIWILLIPNKISADSFFVELSDLNHQDIQQEFFPEAKFNYSFIGFDIGGFPDEKREAVLLKIHPLAPRSHRYFDIIGRGKGSITLKFLAITDDNYPIQYNRDTVAYPIAFPEKIHKLLLSSLGSTKFCIKKIRTFIEATDDVYFEAKIDNQTIEGSDPHDKI